MITEYYPNQLVAKGKSKLAIWYTGERDGIIVQDDKLLFFPDLAQCRAYLEEQGKSFSSEEVMAYHLDALKQWMDSGEHTVNCSFLLNHWNLFTDVATSVHKSFQGDRKEPATNELYDKLFFGCNLPSIRRDGAYYRPHWSKKELRLLKSILRQGYYLFFSACDW